MINIRLIVSVIVINALISRTAGQVWVSPYFLPPPERSGVVFGQVISDDQSISMDEELEPSIVIAIVNVPSTSTPPKIGEFLRNTNTALGATVRLLDGKWIVEVTQKQDYENPSNAEGYTFAVEVDNVKSSIRLSINNINDNLHIMTPINSCTVDELAGQVETACLYNMYDADTFMGLTTHTFEVHGNFDEEQHFTFIVNRTVNAYNREYYLFINEPLDYDKRSIYIFETVAFDQNLNASSMNTIVQVNDLPNMPPRWIQPFSAAQIFEKRSYTFDVVAIDGDTGINRPICYDLFFDENKDYSEYISIGREDGVIDVQPINRDLLNNEFYSFVIYAYKCYDYSWGINGSASIVVDDVNDNSPEFELTPTVIRINESEFVKLPFDSFTIDDIDLGPHATYDVMLTEAVGALELYSRAFNVIPNSGYQKTPFSINVLNSELLDYEDLNWQSFTIRIIASESDDLDDPHTAQQDFVIELINRNDEIPEFGQDEYNVTVSEMMGIDEFIGSVSATDRDINDSIVYSLIGRINDSISINQLGELYTIGERIFDYERQTEVLLQIRVDDTLETYPGEKLHTIYTQYTITVQDENDETPELQLPRVIPHIQENAVAETLVTDGIIGIDPDTTADLHFTIDWEESYASKSGQEAEKKYYENCFYIETIRDPANINRVVGHLKVNPEFTEFNIDYEMYEIIYLSIIVTDHNQKFYENSTEAILTIRVDDVNDNKPEFTEGTLLTERSVLEEASTGTLIGSIYAFDIDGPGNNIISYSIEPQSDTPPDLVEINNSTGVISVKLDKAIDCDIPVREFLHYTVHLTDGLWENEGSIAIRITDINNKNPQMELAQYETVIALYENATAGEHVVTVVASDMDRDPPHNTIQYTFNYQLNPDLQRFFVIDELTGNLSLGQTQLDRDEGAASHDIYINVEDNYQGNGARLRNDTMIHLIVLDVNNKAPELPSPATIQFTVAENVEIGHIIHKDFYAPDKDDFETPNAWVSYEILSIVSTDPTLVINMDLLIAIESDYPENVKMQFGDIVTKRPIRGYYGDWDMTIRAYDHGDEYDSRVQLSSTEVYRLTVEPYNYDTPSVNFPTESSVIRLRLSEQNIGRSLVKTNGEILENFQATDNDGGIYGDITFEIMEDSPHGQYFRLLKISRHQAELTVIQILPPDTYIINVRATDGGGKSQVMNSISIIFVDMEGQPYFTERTFSAAFNETELGLEEMAIIPPAIDPKNEGISAEDVPYPIYYFIDPTFNPVDAAFFVLNKETRRLTLSKELDRETVDHHQIRIISTNDEIYNSQIITLENSLLIVDVTVIDVNDNAPDFEIKSQGIGITSSDYINKVLVTVLATDPDLNDAITYAIVADSIVASGEGIEAIKETAFILDATTGELRLNFIPQASQSGYFQLNISATDLVGHEGFSEVTIFIIADINRITYVFLNTLAELEQNRQFLADTFESMYEMQCFIDDVKPYDIDGINQDGISELRVHFVRNNVVVEAIEIQQISNDISFVTSLKQVLLARSLILQDVPNNNRETGKSSSIDTTKIVLLVLCCVLGALLVVVGLSFFVRSKHLERQLKALSTTEFGSTVSNLKRRDAPNTNIYSIEGSNAVINGTDFKNKEFEDNLSIRSYESDLSGIDNNPIFKNRKESVNPKLIEEIKRKSINPLTNGAAAKRDDENEYI